MPNYGITFGYSKAGAQYQNCMEIKHEICLE